MIKKTLIHLAAEYNATRKNRAQFNMNEIMNRFEQDNWDDNKPYLSRTKAQVELLAKWMNLRRDEYEVHYDDVSIIKGNGKHSDEMEYFQNVRKSIEHHKEKFSKLQPEGVIIAGGLAFKAFEQIIYPQLQHKPDYVIRMRNPGSQGHWGLLKDWLHRYKEAEELQPIGGGRLEVLSFKTTTNKFVLNPAVSKTRSSLPKSSARKSQISSKGSMAWDDFTDQMEKLDIYISMGPDKQSRYTFAKDKKKIFIELFWREV